jgi:hypothetical protein
LRSGAAVIGSTGHWREVVMIMVAYSPRYVAPAEDHTTELARRREIIRAARRANEEAQKISALTRIAAAEREQRRSEFHEAARESLRLLARLERNGDGARPQIHTRRTMTHWYHALHD